MKKVILVFGIILSGLIFISASIVARWQFPATPDEYYNSIMQSFFGVEDHFVMNPMPNTFPDTSLHYSTEGFNSYNNQSTTIDLLARKQCTVSPSIIYYQFYLILDSNAYFNTESFTYDANVRARFKNIFGEDILKSQLTLPVGKSHESGDASPVFRFFNGKAFTAGFKKLYKKPDGKFKGLVLQKIYNATLKDYCRDVADIVCKVLSDKTSFQKWADDYLVRAKADTAFNGITYTSHAADALIGTAEYHKLNCCTASDRIVGIMLRRQIDGSLPDLLACFKTILMDYDPEYYNKVKNNF